MKRAVIFDMDGVLINSEYFYFKRRMDFFKNINIKPDSDKLQDFIGLNDKAIWEKLVIDNLEKRKTLKKEYVKYREENKVNFLDILNPSAIEVLEQLRNKNMKLAIASSSEKKEILRMINECDLHSFFDFVISGEECKESKPNPEIYIRAKEALGVKDKEIFAVEDSEMGIEAAIAAGLEVVALIQQGCKINQTKAKYRINDLRELLEFI